MSQLSSLRGAWRSASSRAAGTAEVLVLGEPGTLPLLPGSTRFWGADLLLPLGFRVDPELPAPAIRHVVGASQDDLVVMDENGHELIAREAFKPLTRTGIRLARDDARSGPANGSRAMSEDRAARYLQIPATYCRSFGGLRWAQYGEAVEFLEGPAAGRTFAFAAEIAVFLEGLQDPGGSILGFGFVLHLLYLIGLGDRAARHGEGCAPCVERIAMPFRELACPLRNAGALCSWLGRAAPHAADPPELAELHEILTRMDWVPQMVLSHRQQGVMDQAEEPGLLSDEFEEMVRRGGGSSVRP